MANGNVQLKAKSLSIGTLGLPIKEVLKFAKRSYKLPKWVEINPDDQTVLLRLDQFRMQNGLFVRAEKINLVDDDIRMNIYLQKRNKKGVLEMEEKAILQAAVSGVWCSLLIHNQGLSQLFRVIQVGTCLIQHMNRF